MVEYGRPVRWCQPSGIASQRWLKAGMDHSRQMFSECSRCMFDRHCSSALCLQQGPRCYLSPALRCSWNIIYSYSICFFAPFFFLLFCFPACSWMIWFNCQINVKINPVQCALTGMHIQINWVLYPADHLILYSE